MDQNSASQRHFSSKRREDSPKPTESNSDSPAPPPRPHTLSRHRANLVGGHFHRGGAWLIEEQRPLSNVGVLGHRADEPQRGCKTRSKNKADGRALAKMKQETSLSSRHLLSPGLAINGDIHLAADDHKEGGPELPLFDHLTARMPKRQNIKSF